jgi:hypothetical protein
VAGLLEVQRLAPEGALASLTATFYAFTYLGFAAPYLLAVAANATSYAVLLVMASGLAIFTALMVGGAARGSQAFQQVRHAVDHGVRT